MHICLFTENKKKIYINKKILILLYKDIYGLKFLKLVNNIK